MLDLTESECFTVAFAVLATLYLLLNWPRGRRR